MTDNLVLLMIAFEAGYRAHERGQNLQAAMAKMFNPDQAGPGAQLEASHVKPKQTH